MNSKEIIALAKEFHKLDAERLSHDRKSRELKNRLESIRELLQAEIGTPEKRDLPMIVAAGKYCITQILKFRPGYIVHDSESISFKVVEK